MSNLLEDVLGFLSFQNSNVRMVTAGTILLAMSSAVVGVFGFLRKRALVGDTVAHSILPGICIAFMLTGVKHPVVLLIGALISGWLSLYLIDIIVRHSRVKEDAALGMILSVFFGLGIFLLTVIQKNGSAAQAGLDKFLFGRAAAMLPEDVMLFGGISIIILIIVMIFFKEFALVSFDKDFAQSIGIPVKWIEFLLTMITVLAVVSGIQAVGVVLMAALLITPPVAARYLTENLRIMIVISAAVGLISGLVGAFISYTAPSMPTGPWIVLVSAILCLIAILFSPKKGTLGRLLKQYHLRRKILEENILKTFFHLGEKANYFFDSQNIQKMVEKREYDQRQLKSGLRSLTRQGFLEKKDDGWLLTKQGYSKGARVIRLHRLWEMYLTTYLKIAPDHVHDDAETIEHIITPELEEELSALLDYPEKDPHDKFIPY